LELILATVKDVDKIIAIQREGFQLLYERYQDEYSPYLETKEPPLLRKTSLAATFLLLFFHPRKQRDRWFFKNSNR